MSFNRRIFRRQCFDIFFESSEEWFRLITANDPRHALMADIYSFGVARGGRNGGIDLRAVDVYYGNRPFESIREIVKTEEGFPELRRRHLPERGASLCYQRTDTGLVIVRLLPAITENYRQPESGIILDQMHNVTALTGLPTLRKHWRYLFAYLQITSIDGEPTFGDSCRVRWLRWTRNLIIDEKLQAPRIITVTGKILYFGAAVGMSGFLLSLIQAVFHVNGVDCP